MSKEIGKSAAPRRIFKPTIPTTRRSTQRSFTGVTGGCDGVGWETCDQNDSCNSKVKGKHKSIKPRGKKEFIQLDATFNGINKIATDFKAEKAFISPEVSGFGHSNDTRSSQSDSPRGSTATGAGGGAGQINGLSVKVKSDDEPSYGNSYKTINMGDHHGKAVSKPGEETEENIESIQRALYRDDFVSLYDPNEEDMTPIGWKCVSQHQAFKQENKRDSKSSAIKFDKWACTKKEQDKMVLFQLPQMLLNSSDGHVGKIRMYQSGKMELIDTRTGVVHDLLHTDYQVNPHPPCDDDDDDNDSDNNSDTDNNSEENGDAFKEAATANGRSHLSTGWIKKEVEDDKLNDRNYDSPLPPTTFSKPSTSKSYLSSSMQSPSSSKLNTSRSSSSKSKLSTSKSSSQNPKANNSKLNRRNKCDKDEVNGDDDTDDDDDDDRNINQSYREACTFDGEKVVCLGPISNNELLIGRPRLDKFIDI